MSYSTGSTVDDKIISLLEQILEELKTMNVQLSDVEKRIREVDDTISKE